MRTRAWGETGTRRGPEAPWTTFQARLCRARSVAVLSQVDGARWLSLEGKSTVNTESEAVRDAELRYAQRYRTPRVNPKRVVIEVRVERVLGSSDLLDRAED